MRIRSIVLTVLIALFVATIAIGCADTGGGQYQDSHSGHSH
jgi:hypothetical protein